MNTITYLITRPDNTFFKIIDEHCEYPVGDNYDKLLLEETNKYLSEKLRAKNLYVKKLIMFLRLKYSDDCKSEQTQIELASILKKVMSHMKVSLRNNVAMQMEFERLVNIKHNLNDINMFSKKFNKNIEIVDTIIKTLQNSLNMKIVEFTPSVNCKCICCGSIEN